MAKRPSSSKLDDYGGYTPPEQHTPIVVQAKKTQIYKKHQAEIAREI